MSAHLIVAVTLIYLYIAVESAIVGNKPLAIIYAGYAWANCGMWLLAD